jgi:hypothetical protein
MMEGGSKLWELEQQFWLGGVEVYRQHLADNSLMVFPGMVLTKPQTVESIASGPRWTSVSFTEQRLVQLTPGTVALIYRASSARGPEEAPYSALVSSVYVKQDDDWRLALHQQSPESKPK